MTYQDKLSNIIERLKEVKEKHPDLTLQRISDHTGVSLTTVTRVFSEKSETMSFRYDSIRPIAQMLLGIDNLDEGDEDEKALKSVIQLKDARIKELEAAVQQEKEKYSDKLEKVREQHQKRVDFLMHQIELKDKRIDTLMAALDSRHEMYEELHKQHIDIVNQIIERKVIL